MEFRNKDDSVARQQKESYRIRPSSDSSQGDNRKYPHIEGRIPDKIPRNARLKSRTPLGSLEALDDYGLLEGGTSVPNYYTSLRQRNRRCLEMKARSSRLRDREKKNNSMILESLYHMIFVLVRRGLRIEHFCRERDTEGRGMIDRTIFWKLISNLGLPFRARDIDEVIQRYTVPSSDKVDYESLLRDSDILLQNDSHDDKMTHEHEHSNENDSDESINKYISSYSLIMIKLKQILQEKVDSLHISLESFYREFARWDVDGTGTITATQFFRVLLRFHIDYLEDQEQDFVVELLDIRHEGRINFEVFLSFCFADKLPYAVTNNSPYGMTMKSLYGKGYNNSIEADSACSILNNSMSKSAISHDILTTGNNDNNDLNDDSNNNNDISTTSSPFEIEEVRGRSTTLKPRPHTASSFEPIIRRTQPQTGTVAVRPEHSQLPQINHDDRDSAMRPPHVIHSNNVKLSLSRRPLTASARVQHTTDYANAIPSQNKNNIQKLGTKNKSPFHSYDNTTSGRDRKNTATTTTRNRTSKGYNDNDDRDDDYYDEEEDFIEDYDDFDVFSGGLATRSHSVYSGDDEMDILMNDNNIYTTSSNNSNFGRDLYRQALESPFEYDDIIIPEGGVVCSAPEEERPAPSSYRSINDVVVVLTDDDIHNLNIPLPWDERSKQHRRNSSTGSPLPDTVATRALTAIRDLVLARHRDGKRMHELFVHFERHGSGLFDANDLRRAASDLCIQLTAEEAEEAVSYLAIDGVDKVSFGEFVVFITDSEHKDLQIRVQQVIADQLEKYGVSYSERLHAAFMPPKDISFSHGDGSSNNNNNNNEFITPAMFTRSITNLDLDLSSSDINRLVARFDFHGIGHVSVPRFLRMVRDNNPSWERTLVSLSYYEIAKQEKQEALRILSATAVSSSASAGKSSSSSVSSPRNGNGNGGTGAMSASSMAGLDAGLVEMAAYLGIGVFSESHMLWIAAEALKAPVPAGWVVQTDKKGRTCFYNDILQVTRHDHPLDPYYRKLRDQARYGVSSRQKADGITKTPTATTTPSTVSHPRRPLDRPPRPASAISQRAITRPSFLSFQHENERMSANPSSSGVAGAATTIATARSYVSGTMMATTTTMTYVGDTGRPRPKSAYPTTRAVQYNIVHWYEEEPQPLPSTDRLRVPQAASNDTQSSLSHSSVPREPEAKRYVPSYMQPISSRPASAPFSRRNESTTITTTTTKPDSHVATTTQSTSSSFANKIFKSNQKLRSNSAKESTSSSLNNKTKHVTEDIDFQIELNDSVDLSSKPPVKKETFKEQHNDVILDPGLQKLSPYLRKNSIPPKIVLGPKKLSVVDRALHQTAPGTIPYSMPKKMKRIPKNQIQQHGNNNINNDVNGAGAGTGTGTDETREMKLANMYKDDLLGQLDAIIIAARRAEIFKQKKGTSSVDFPRSGITPAMFTRSITNLDLDLSSSDIN
eukprot:gene3023-5927_t